MDDANKPVETAETAAPAQIVDSEGTAFVKFEQKFKAPRKTAVAEAIKAGRPAPTQRPPFDVYLPQYTWEQILAGVNENSKIRDLVVSLVNELVQTEARGQIINEENPVNSDAELDKTKLTLQHLSTLSTADRASSTAIDKDDLAAFVLDYEKYLPTIITGLTTDQAKLIASAAKQKFSAFKTRPEFLAKLREFLARFADSAPAEVVAKHVEVIEQLDAIADKYLQRPEVDRFASMFASMQ